VIDVSITSSKVIGYKQSGLRVLECTCLLCRFPSRITQLRFHLGSSGRGVVSGLNIGLCLIYATLVANCSWSSAKLLVKLLTQDERILTRCQLHHLIHCHVGSFYLATNV